MNHFVELEKFKNTLKKNNAHGLAVDIDETLSFTLGYWFTEMARLFGNPENLSLEEMIKKYRYSKNVPYWQSPEAQQWMEAQRENNELQTRLEVLDHADEYLREVATIRPVVAYITIRPASVLKGTMGWLKMHNFPEAVVIARPNFVSHNEGNAWKAAVLEYLYPAVDSMIDDNSEVLKYLPADYQGKFFLYATEEYALTKHAVFCCPTWKEVLHNIKAQA